MEVEKKPQKKIKSYNAKRHNTNVNTDKKLQRKIKKHIMQVKIDKANK